LVTILAMLSVLLILVCAVLFYIFIFSPLNKLKEKLSNLDKGEVPRITSRHRNNEIGELEDSLKAHFHYLGRAVRYTVSMSRGEFDESFEKKGPSDQIGKAMLQLKVQLKRTKIEAERRRSTDEQQNWTAKGLATIGELLRNTEDDISIMSNEFIKELVSYVDMEVGGFFIVKDDEGDEPMLELTGSYAFDREKKIEKQFKFGEGLVGRCALERDSIVITDLPEDYIRIRSGLGEDDPATLILVPVLLDEQVLGVIELASFNEVPDYKINFIKSLSTSIAASVTKVKVNVSTAKLLQQSRQQSEELFSREEEMRLGLEELRSTQEQSAIREAQLLSDVEKLKEQLKEK
jgi:methyl-accepting chemotaxis protein